MRTDRVSLALVLVALLAACAHPTLRDGAPSGPAPETRPGDVIPGPEPKSRYGNPPYYEALGRRYFVLDSADGYRERGIASWYGTKFHGRRTSSGEPYDMHAMTAAHKSLPLPTWVEVTNLRNDKTVLVRVNDRGPFVENRIIDLSYEAATRLDIVTDGTALVEVRALTFGPGAEVGPAPVSDAVVESTPATAAPPAVAAAAPPPPAETATDSRPDEAIAPLALPRMFAQVGAFTEAANAAGLQSHLQETGFVSAAVHASDDESPAWFRVRVGPVYGAADYDALVARLADAGLSNVSLVIE